jgi:PiT family inorganic phosphate transporter
MTVALFVLLALAVAFDFLNGFHDSSNVVATVITSGAMRPRVALFTAAAAHFAAPFVLPLAVATTLGEDMLHDQAIQINVVIAGLASAVAWNIVTWYLGLPSSSSHALVGGLLGAAILSNGFGVVRLPGLIKIVIALLISPLLGMVAGWLVMRLTLWLARDANPSVNRTFKILQIITLLGLAFGHGSNDAQKTMGVITMGLLAGGMISSFHVPTWVILISASAIALGTSLGGWRLIKTLGGRILRIRPIHGFTSQIAGAMVIVGASILGGPVSTTQVMSSAIMGVGAAERLGKVHWLILRDLAMAWVLTIPTTALLAAGVYLVFWGL